MKAQWSFKILIIPFFIPSGFPSHCPPSCFSLGSPAFIFEVQESVKRRMKEWWWWWWGRCGRCGGEGGGGGGGGGGQYGDWFPQSASGHQSRAEYQGALKGPSEVGPMEVCPQHYVALHHSLLLIGVQRVKPTFPSPWEIPSIRRP